MSLETLSTEELIRMAMGTRSISHELKISLDAYFKVRSYLEYEDFGNYRVFNLDESFVPLATYKIHKLKEGIVDRKYISVVK